MNIEELTALLNEIMATEKVLTPNTNLKEIAEWDSLSLVLFLSHLNVHYELVLDAEVVKACETVNDLYQLVSEKL